MQLLIWPSAITHTQTHTYCMCVWKQIEEKGNLITLAQFISNEHCNRNEKKIKSIVFYQFIFNHSADRQWCVCVCVPFWNENYSEKSCIFQREREKDKKLNNNVHCITHYQYRKNPICMHNTYHNNTTTNGCQKMGFLLLL